MQRDPRECLTWSGAKISRSGGITGSGFTSPDIFMLMTSSDFMRMKALSVEAVMYMSTFRLRYPKIFSL